MFGNYIVHNTSQYKLLYNISHHQSSSSMAYPPIRRNSSGGEYNNPKHLPTFTNRKSTTCRWGLILNVPVTVTPSLPFSSSYSKCRKQMCVFDEEVTSQWLIPPRKDDNNRTASHSGGKKEATSESG